MTFDLKKDGKRIIGVLLAAVLMALNIKTFVRAGDLFPGGVTGLTVLIQRLAEKSWGVAIPYSPVNLLLNAFPVYIGFRFVGKKFTLLSLMMIFVSSILTDLFPAYVITYDPLLVAIFGGLISGTAISMCLSVDATSGGTDFIAIYLSEQKGRETWNIIFAINSSILLAGGFTFGWTGALYSIVYQFVSLQVIHLMYRAYQYQTLLIVTSKPKRICEAIHRLSHHGATVLDAYGSYLGHKTSLVYSVVAADDTSRIYSICKKIDKSAFVNTISTSRIIGRFYMRPRD